MSWPSPPASSLSSRSGSPRFGISWRRSGSPLAAAKPSGTRKAISQDSSAHVEPGCRSSLYFLQRSSHGPSTECYFDFALGGIFDDKSRFVAVLHCAFDQTDRVLIERRLRTLRTLNEQTTSMADQQSYHAACLDSLSSNPWDLQFILKYAATLPSVDRVLEVHRVGTVGVPADSPAAPSQFRFRRRSSAISSESPRTDGTASTSDIGWPGHLFAAIDEEEPPPWPMLQALNTNQPVLVEDIGSLTEGFERRGWATPWSVFASVQREPADR